MAEVEAEVGQGAEHAGFGVVRLPFRGLRFWLGIGGASAGGLDVDVGELDVFDGVAGDAGEDGAELAGGVVAGEVADEDAAEGADFGGLVASRLWGRAGVRRGA